MNDMDRGALKRMTDLHAVYRMFNEDGRLLYVGLTGRLSHRLGNHAEKRWFPQVATIELEWFPTKAAAALAEQHAIRNERPLLNIVGNREHLHRHRKSGFPSAGPVAVPGVHADAPELTVREAVEDGVFGLTSNLERARKRVQRAGLEPVGRRGDGSLTYTRADLFTAARDRRQKEPAI